MSTSWSKSNRRVVTSSAIQSLPTSLLTHLAEVVNAQPDWRFDLVVVDAETSIEKIAEVANEPSLDQIRETLTRAKKLVLSGDTGIACILAWGAFEASMRKVRNAAELHGRIAPNELMRTLYSNGILSHEEFRELQELFNIRTQIVHGMATPVIDAEKVCDLIAITNKLLADGRRKDSAAHA
jgi:hypothetical protein